MKFFLVLLLSLGVTESYAYPDYIKTVLCYPVDDYYAEPIIELGGRTQICFEFDDLSPEVNNYSYRIIHCDPDGNASNISSFHYVEGFNSQQITDYEFSFDTQIPYTHYTLLLPNEDMKIKLSGNYRIEVFKDENPDSIIISQPFAMIENKVSISSRLKNPSNTQYLNTSQEFGFTVHYDNVVINNPMRDVKCYVVQNQDPNSRRDFSPTFVRPNQLVYGDGINNIFNGLAPFRNFQSYSFVYFTQYVRQILKDPEGRYNIVLQPGKVYPSYVPQPGQNGGFVVKAENVAKPKLEADYAMVHFAVYAPQKIADADVYIYGKFSGWQFHPDLKMEYDTINRAYVGQTMLKQGDYDYMYAVLPVGEETPDLVSLQGNFYQHRNIYTIRCYLFDYQLGYYRLVGYKSVVG